MRVTISRPYTFVNVTLNLFIIILVIIPYVFLFKAGLMIHKSHYSDLLSRSFRRFVSPNEWDSCPANPVKGFLAANEDIIDCQLTLYKFHEFLPQLGHSLSIQESTQLFQVLDISGNLLLSWGEISIQYFGLDKGALEYQLQRKTQFGNQPFSFIRIPWSSYEPYRFYDTSNIII